MGAAGLLGNTDLHATNACCISKHSYHQEWNVRVLLSTNDCVHTQAVYLQAVSAIVSNTNFYAHNLHAV